MDLHLAIEPHDTLVVSLREGAEQTSASVRPSRAGALALWRALEMAMTEGYGECFWPGATGGQYWWIFKRDGETLQTMAMWTRGGASQWEHVFRAADAATFVQDRVSQEFARLGLGVGE